MEFAVRNVRDIDAEEKHYLENALGRQLQENQQVVIRVLDVGVEPEQAVRRRALAEASEIACRGRANTATQGISTQEADAAIEEAIDHVRRRDS